MPKSGGKILFVVVILGLAAIVFAGYPSSKRSRYPNRSKYGRGHGHGHGHGRPTRPGRCPKYEEYSTCTSPCTTRSCENLNPDPEIACPAVCLTGCECIDGWRRLDGTCVPETQCPQYCPNSNETKSDCYNECANGRACPGVRGPDQACTRECQIDVCDCSPGYYRNECGDCVLEAECSSPCTCPENESIQCVNSCSKTTCAFILSGALRRCQAYCSRQCECIEGYARLETGECVPEAYCCV